METFVLLSLLLGAKYIPANYVRYYHNIAIIMHLLKMDMLVLP